MGYIIKPLITEKMNALTDKSSSEKKLRAANEKSAKAKNAVEEKRSYSYKRKKTGETISKEKTVYTYTKPAQLKYGFIVKPEANKIEIKKEVEALYNVTVIAVNTMRYAGKAKSRYTKTGVVKGRLNSYKKAVVTLREGDSIDFYSNI